MLAVGLTIALFAFWAVVGYAVLRAVAARIDAVQEVLLAPVIGLIVVTIALFLFSRFGLPVKRFAYPLTVVLLVAAVAPLLVARPRVPWRDWAPFGLVMLAALALAAWPMLEYGFNWLSLCNDDMANYCLGAARFHDFGFFHNPTPQDLVGGADYSQYYWFLHVRMMVRPGIELLLAWLMGVTRLTAHEVFMPAIFALHLCQVSALGALMHPSRATRKPAIVACALLAASALAAFGALYQLIAQVGGMALLAATVAVLTLPAGDAIDGPAGPSPVRRGILAGLLGAGLFLLYPEVIPIAGASWMVYLLFQALRRRVRVRPLLTFTGAALVAMLVLLGTQVVGIVGFLFAQTSTGSADLETHATLFPYYQIPSGLADFWGFFPITHVPLEPTASFGVAAGGSLLLFTAAVAGWLAWRGRAVAVCCSVMLALTVFLAYKGAHFGLYKMAMFLQPFALGTVALAAFALLQRGWVRTIALVLLAVPGVVVQQSYVNGSRGTGAAGGYPEVADPSRSRVNHDFEQTVAGRRGGIVSDTSNVVIAKFQAYLARGTPTSFPVSPVGIQVLQTLVPSLAPKDVRETGERLHDAVIAQWPRYEFNLHDPASPSATNPFRYAELGPLAAPATTTAPDAALRDDTLVAAGPKQTIVNRWNARRKLGPRADEINFVARPMDRARDHLMLVESELGRAYHSSARQISMFQLEPDATFLLNSTMAGVGRQFVFEVVGPSPGVRLMVELTASFRGDRKNELPSAAVAIDSGRKAFGIVGRGSARVFSPPLEPQILGGRSFVGIDMGREAVPFRVQRRGLMTLYGRDVLLDRRLLVCFARDISAVSQRQYASLRPPARLEKFPDDLQNQDLEYSGIYEDGWVSDRAWCAPALAWGADAVLVKGYVPELGDPAFQTEVTVSVEGREVARKTVGVKQFEVRVQLPPELRTGAAAAALMSARRARIGIEFSRLQNLPQPDGRPVGALILTAGFDSPPAPPLAVQKFPHDFHNNPLLSPAGLYPDGWAAPRTSFNLSQPPANGYLVVRGQVPKISDDGFTTEVRVRIDGRQLASRSLGVGAFQLIVPAAPEASGSTRRQVELDFTNVQQLPAGDGRAVGAQILFAGFAPEPLPPSGIETFPDDLKKPLVQPTGIYDDGWAGQAVALDLGQAPDADTITVEGMVPKIGTADGFATTVSVSVDGKEVGRQSVGLDRFSISLPLSDTPASPADGQKRHVELRFSQVQALPAPDGRSVGAKLTSVRFESLAG